MTVDLNPSVSSSMRGIAGIAERSVATALTDSTRLHRHIAEIEIKPNDPYTPQSLPQPEAGECQTVPVIRAHPAEFAEQSTRFTIFHLAAFARDELSGQRPLDKLKLRIRHWESLQSKALILDISSNG
jgi:hypothetical protein